MTPNNESNSTSNRNKKDKKEEMTVLTVRISQDLDEVLNKVCEEEKMTKADLIRSYLELTRYVTIDQKLLNTLEELDNVLNEVSEKRRVNKVNLIRNYLEMIKFVLIDKGSIRSYDERDLIIIKRKTFKKSVNKYKEEEQIRYGVKFARFINDLARLQGKIDDLEWKLDLCEHLGFFNKFIDKENYILFSKRFGPKKFVEAFVFKLINHQADANFDISFTTEGIESKSSIEKNYIKIINPKDRHSSYYAFEFAKLKREKD